MARTYLFAASLLLMILTNAAPASAQSATIGTPFSGAGANYYERIGVGFGGRVGNVFFNHGGMGALPPLGGLVNDQPVDQRWIRIRRPTIVVGGELTLASLEIKTNEQSGVSEAPLQLKSNCGTLVIDDFGRQRISTDELLNRWIVPLETGYDYLNLASGRKIQVPFDQLIVLILSGRSQVDDRLVAYRDP